MITIKKSFLNYITAGKQGSRLKSREANSQEKEAEQRSQQNRAVGRREQELEPVNSGAELANMRGWVSIPCDFIGISL